jgi:alanine racemase
VAHLAEARRVHAVAPSTVVYVLNGIAPGSASAFAEANARPVIGDLAELAEWEAFCAASGWNGGAALHFDTGMNRLGFSMDEAAALAPRASKPNHGITLVMSHLACAETPKHPMNERQIQQFREIRTMFRGIPSSLANSTGIFLGGATHCDMVRPGLGLYGGNPTPEHDNPMRPVVELKGRILQVKKVASGSSVGYEAAWTARHPSHIATVAVGYADGYLRAAGATGRQAHAEVVIAGKRCPVIGRVSMDLLAVDVTNIPEKDVHRGDFAILIGAKIGIDDLAAWSGTIGYEVLTSLGRRYTRKYRIG